MTKDAYYRFADGRHPDGYRQEQIQTLKQAIQAKENWLVLGLPGMGVSNLLRFLVTRTDWGDRNVIFAYLDCDTLDDCQDSEVFFGEIAREFSRQLPPGKAGEDGQGYARLKRYVLDVSVDPLDRLAVVADKTDPILSAADSRFYRRLKALTDLNKGVCFVFAASPHMLSAIDPEELLFAGRRLVVAPFDERDVAGAIREEGWRLGREFDPAEEKQLARLTGGHAGLLRALSSAVVGGGVGLSEPDVALVERLLARADVEARCRRIWHALDAPQQATLSTIAKEQPGPLAHDSLLWLHEFGLVDEHEGEWRPFSPLFAGFVLAQPVSALPLEPVTIVGPTTRMVHGREIVVAGKVYVGNREVEVTPLELRFIACLLREPRLYTKHEIAEYVYFEDQGAVEDPLAEAQRIDDLVRRVRRRLGDQYIKTHRGRGYELLR
jgi:hypothetical protein